MILYVDKLPLYFLCSFCWYFHKIFWWFYFNENSNCCVFASLPFYSNLPVYCTLPVYYFGWNLPAFPFIPPSSPSIWNSRVASGVNPWSCLYFQGFRGSKLLNGCLVVWPSNQGMSARNKVIFRIQNRYLWSVILEFGQQYFWNIWILVCCRFNSYFTLITKE